jgi:2-haloacid dehalogenase
MGAVDVGRLEALTFDCYGTLIDWETGILAALRPVLERHGVSVADDELLETYARHEATVETGDYVSYREVLAWALRGVCHAHRVEPSSDDTRAFSESVGDWPPFPDSAPALARLAKRFRLGVITNCDDDLFALSNRRLGVTFDWVVTAQQVRSYKPNPLGFEVALERMAVPRDRVLHVAQSLYHDHAPAKQLGLSTAWINRRGDRAGFGATPPSPATPDLTAPDMATFARLALGEAEPSP